MHTSLSEGCQKYFSKKTKKAFFKKDIVHREGKSELLIGLFIQVGWAGWLWLLCTVPWVLPGAFCSARNSSLVLCSFSCRAGFESLTNLLVHSNNPSRALSPVKIFYQGVWQWVFAGCNYDTEKREQSLYRVFTWSKGDFPRQIWGWISCTTNSVHLFSFSTG